MSKLLKTLLANTGFATTPGDALQTSEMQELEQRAYFKGVSQPDFYAALNHDEPGLAATIFGADAVPADEEALAAAEEKAAQKRLRDEEEKAEAKRIADEEAEAQRLAAEQAEAQRLAQEQADAEAEAQRIAQEQADAAEAQRQADEAQCQTDEAAKAAQGTGGDAGPADTEAGGDTDAAGAGGDAGPADEEAGDDKAGE